MRTKKERKEAIKALTHDLPQYKRIELWYIFNEIEQELEGLQAFKRSVDEALNSGDGSYRP